MAPWLGRKGIPEAKVYVKAYRPQAWRTIHNRKYAYPAERTAETEVDAHRVFLMGWAAIDAAIPEALEALHVEVKAWRVPD